MSKNEHAVVQFNSKVASLRLSLLQACKTNTRSSTAFLSRTFIEHQTIEFRGSSSADQHTPRDRGEGPCDDVVSFPGKYGAAGWGAVVSFALDPDVDIVASTVFLPDKTSNGFGEHTDNPETPGECYCCALYGEPKPWGCCWFKLWMANVKMAVQLGHTLQVYFFRGQCGKGKVKWEDLVEHSRVCDNVLSGLSQSKQAAIRATEEYPFDGLGGSQKGEVAWLDKMGFTYEEKDIGPFLDTAKSTMGGQLTPGLNVSIASFNESEYPDSYHEILCPLINDRAIDSSFAFYPIGSPFTNKHATDPTQEDDTRCFCYNLYGFKVPHGCMWMKKATINYERAAKAKQKLVVVHSPCGSGQTPYVPSWISLHHHMATRMALVTSIAGRLIQLLRAAPQNDPLPALSSIHRTCDPMGSDWADGLAELFKPLLTDEEVQLLQQYAGLAMSQCSELAWIAHKGYEYELVGASEWIRANQERQIHRSKPAGGVLNYYIDSKADDRTALSGENVFQMSWDNQPEWADSKNVAPWLEPPRADDDGRPSICSVFNLCGRWVTLGSLL
jgi:hypothetical protein